MTDRQFRGHAFDLFQRAQRLLLDHMPIAGHFEPGRMERVDEPAYSPLAFREAIANAICHRDYASGGSSIGVRRLREAGRLERIGPAKGGRWKVIR